MDTLTDPATLRDRTDVEYVEADPETNEGHYEAYEDHAGTVVVGTVDDGRLALLEHDEVDDRRPSFTRVEEGGDYVTAAERIVRDGTGLDVRIDEALRVRHHTYRTDDGAETTGYDVVFTATPTGDGEVDPDAGHDWTPAWFELPIEVGVDGKAGSDLRLLVDHAD